MFGVTASGVRLDHYHPTDNEDDTDAQFDPVWEARTHVDADGWTAELWVPVLAAALQRPARASLGPERQAVAAAAQRRELLGRRRTHRARLVVAVRRAARHRRRAADHPPRGAALRLGFVADDRQPRSRTTRSTMAWQPERTRRRRHESRHRIEPDARGDDQPRLRPDRSRPGRSEPDGVRNDLRRAAAVLHRGQQRARGGDVATTTTRGGSARGRPGRRRATTSTIRRPTRSSAPRS